MKKITYCDDKDIPKFSYLEDLGNFNNLPTPNKIIDWHEYFRLQSECFDYRDFRQVLKAGDREFRCFHNVECLFGHTLGLAVVQPADWHLEGGKTFKYAEEPVYVRLGCDHKWEECSRDWCQANKVPHYGKCYHVYHCPVCKMVNAQDSSD